MQFCDVVTAFGFLHCCVAYILCFSHFFILDKKVTKLHRLMSYEKLTLLRIRNLQKFICTLSYIIGLNA